MTILPPLDWALAERLGRRFARSGPITQEGLGGGGPTTAEIRDAVASLHTAAERAIGLVAEASGLAVDARPPVYAVDRAGWAQANAQIGRRLFDRVEPVNPPGLHAKVLGRANAVIAAGATRLFGSKVLGQYDPFHPGGRLLLVVPNLLAAERALGVPPEDFRLWACLHEQAHAVQFSAAAWLLDHLVALVRRVAADTGAQWLGKLATRADSDASQALESVMATMSLIEGHADIMMDLAGREVLGSWGQLRAISDSSQQRSRSGWLARLGVLSKAEQYATGSAFCRAVLAEGGTAALNRAFSGAWALPSPAEIADPESWLERVHG